MTQSCSSVDLLLMVYADGEATEPERALVEGHLRQCKRCRARLQEWIELRHTTIDAVHREASRSLSTDTLDTAGATATKVRREDASSGIANLIGLTLTVVLLLALPLTLRYLHAPQSGVQTSARATTTTSQTIAAQHLALVTASTASTATSFAVSTSSMLEPASVRQTLPPASPTVAPAYPGLIAVSLHGTLQIFSAQGSRTIRVPGSLVAPRFSHSGQWLLFERIGVGHQATLWLAPISDLNSPFEVPPPAEQGLARWSPQRDEFVVASPNGALWLVDPRQLTEQPILPATSPITNLAWTVDGNAVLVERRAVDRSGQQLVEVSRSGRVEILTQTEKPQDMLRAPFLGAPAGNDMVLFWTARLGSPPTAPAQLDERAGKRTIHLLDHVRRFSADVAVNPVRPQTVAVIEQAAGSSGTSDVRLLHLAGDAVQSKVLLSGQALDDLAWRPDGTELALAVGASTPQGFKKRIVVISPNGRQGPQGLTSGPDDSVPTWSSGGNWLLFVRQAGSHAELWLNNVQSKTMLRIANDLPALPEIPNLDFGLSGLVSYRGIFSWSAAGPTP
ncbi:MAG: zf-HC2 domain-containing protein [Chloroflexi bacterium]|nr:zf-HC2 domain-containing protein [Chloroflexota bacterium]